MSKLTKAAIFFFALSIILWLLVVVVNPSGLDIVALLMAIGASITFVCLFICCVVKRFKKNISPYKIFAISDVLTGIGIAIYALYDIHTDAGFFAGLLGTLLLMFVVPLTIVILIINLIVWAVNTRKFKKLRKY